MIMRLALNLFHFHPVLGALYALCRVPNFYAIQPLGQFLITNCTKLFDWINWQEVNPQMSMENIVSQVQKSANSTMYNWEIHPWRQCYQCSIKKFIPMKNIYLWKASTCYPWHHSGTSYNIDIQHVVLGVLAPIETVGTEVTDTRTRRTNSTHLHRIV